MKRRESRRGRDLLLGTALLLGVAACTWQGIKPEGEATRHLYISGDAAHVADGAIAQIAAPYLDTSFFDVDIESLQRELGELAWLSEIKVSRHWPDGVVVHVTEHQPVARWGDAGVLSAAGKIFVPPADSRPRDLVALDGPDAAGMQVYEQYRTLSAQLAGSGVSIAALRLNARGSWTATLDNRLELRLGRENLAQRVQRFVDYALADESARGALATAGYVDLRYSDGFAVGGERAVDGQGRDDEQAA